MATDSAGRQGPGQLEADTLTSRGAPESASSSMFSVWAGRGLLLRAAQAPTLNAHLAGLHQEAEVGGRCFCSSPHPSGTSEDGEVSSWRVARVAVSSSDPHGRDPAQPPTTTHPSTGRKRTSRHRALQKGVSSLRTNNRDNVGTGSTAGRALDPSGRADRMLSE